VAFGPTQRRGYLKGLAYQASDDGLALTVALRAALTTSFSTIESGRLILGTSTNGHSIEFAAPAYLSPSDVLGLLGRFDDIYTESKARLISGGTASPTDAEILDEMLTDPFLTSVRSYRADFSELNYVDC